MFGDPANLPSELPGAGLQARCRVSIFRGRPWGLRPGESGLDLRVVEGCLAQRRKIGHELEATHPRTKLLHTFTVTGIRIPLKTGWREPMAGLDSTLDCGHLKRRYRSRISRVPRFRSRLTGTAPALCRCSRCHDQPSALPHQAPCLPLKASVRRIAEQNLRF